MKLPITLKFKEFRKFFDETTFSNRYLKISTDRGSWSFGDVRWFGMLNMDEMITITSIEVRLPQFSIGDTVMIVDDGNTDYTGEIGCIQDIDNSMYCVDLGSIKWRFKKSKLVKIPTNLLPLLQD